MASIIEGGQGFSSNKQQRGTRLRNKLRHDHFKISQKFKAETFFIALVSILVSGCLSPELERTIDLVQDSGDSNGNGNNNNGGTGGNGGNGGGNGANHPLCSTGGLPIIEPNSNDDFIFEAEDARVITGDWLSLSTPVADFLGTGYMKFERSQFTSEQNHSYNGSDLIFHIDVVNSGTYYIQSRVARAVPANTRMCGHHDTSCCPWNRTTCSRTDLNNDYFFETTSRSRVKVYSTLGSSSVGLWEVDGTFDISGNHEQPRFNLSVGVHEIKISGRSNMHAIDRVFIGRDNRFSETAPISPYRCENQN